MLSRTCAACRWCVLAAGGAPAGRRCAIDGRCLVALEGSAGPCPRCCACSVSSTACPQPRRRWSTRPSCRCRSTQPIHAPTPRLGRSAGEARRRRGRPAPKPPTRAALGAGTGQQAAGGRWQATGGVHCDSPKSATVAAAAQQPRWRLGCSQLLPPPCPASPACRTVIYCKVGCRPLPKKECLREALWGSPRGDQRGSGAGARGVLSARTCRAAGSAQRGGAHAWRLRKEGTKERAPGERHNRL